MQAYRDLVVWQKARELALVAYRATQALPPTERFGLAAQIQRSAVSVPSNIAEGSGRHHSGDFARFLDHAAGSASELECQIELCADLGYLDPETAQTIQSRCIEVRKMLYAFRKHLVAPKTDN